MLKVHYIPSWNGDLRLEPDAADPEKATTLAIVKPTASERQQLRTMLAAFSERGWLEEVGNDFSGSPSEAGSSGPSAFRYTRPSARSGRSSFPSRSRAGTC